MFQALLSSREQSNNTQPRAFSPWSWMLVLGFSLSICLRWERGQSAALCGTGAGPAPGCWASWGKRGTGVLSLSCRAQMSKSFFPVLRSIHAALVSMTDTSPYPGEEAGQLARGNGRGRSPQRFSQLSSRLSSQKPVAAQGSGLSSPACISCQEKATQTGVWNTSPQPETLRHSSRQQKGCCWQRERVVCDCCTKLSPLGLFSRVGLAPCPSPPSLRSYRALKEKSGWRALHSASSRERSGNFAYRNTGQHLLWGTKTCGYGW